MDVVKGIERGACKRQVHVKFPGLRNEHRTRVPVWNEKKKAHQKKVITDAESSSKGRTTPQKSIMEARDKARRSMFNVEAWMTSYSKIETRAPFVPKIW